MLRMLRLKSSDPHFNGHPYYNPRYLAEQWVLSVQRYLSSDTILVNRNGGFIPYHETRILSTVESERLAWPDKLEDEIITIAKWPEGRHYYLCSNKGHIFVPDKHSTFEAAKQAALNYVPADQIRSKC